MTENKRYFKRMWEDEYYIFDSNTISESDFEEKLEYQDYKAFEDSMMGDEVVDRLNWLEEENTRLKERNNRQAKQLDNLYTLIEKQDWKTLTGLIQEFQECEEQLQKEWREIE